MRQAIIPLLLYLLLQIPVFFIGMNWKIDRKKVCLTTVLKSWLFGQMTLFAIIQILAIPMIQFHLHFNVLFFSFLTISILFMIRGLMLFCKAGKHVFPSVITSVKSLSWISILFALIACFIVLDHFCIYLFGQHIDWDDSRWLAQANDALAYGDMITRSFSTGEFVGAFTEVKEVSSPWPMMLAILSRLLNTRVTIAAHTVYAPFELLAMYAVYYLISGELFKKNESRYSFLMLVGVVFFFFGGTRHTQATVSLVRIWQGKATVAAVILPLMFYLFLCIHKRDETSDWLKLPVLCCAACLMSGMGIAMSEILTGVFGLYDLLVYRRWKRIPFWLLALIPSAVSAVIYFFYKG